MKIATKLLEITLQLFDDGAAAGAPSTLEGAPSAQAETNATPKTGRSGKSGEVIYGKQSAPAAEVQEQQEPEVQKTEQERRAEYEKFLADYKDLDTERTNKIINNRFKNTKGLEERFNSVAPILDILATKYNVESGDLEGLTRAINSDNSYYEAAAEDAGMSVEQFKQFEEIRRENTRLSLIAQRTEGQQKAEQEIAGWMRDGEIVKGIYPNFDFKAEAQNQGFLDMLKAGIPVQHAYEVLHMDDIKTGVAQFAATATEKKTVESIRSRGLRPTENGTNAQSGVIVKSDVSKLTREDRAEILRRVQRGERIEF